MENMSGKWCYLSFGYSAKDEMGVSKKVKMQAKAICSVLGECDTFFFQHDIIEVIESENKGEIIIRSNNQINIFELVNKYDYFYYRWGGANRYFNHILKCASRNGKINIIELPTYPMTIADFEVVKSRIQNKNYRGAIRLLFGAFYIDEVLFRIQKRWMNYIVLSSFNQKVHGVNTINILNGIEIKSVPERNILKFQSDIFSMLIVANISMWHGIDRIVEGIKRYKGNKKIRLIVVGDGEALPSIKKMVKEAGMDRTVSFEGRKFGKELDSYFDNCDVAIGSLGLHRLKIRPSTLKSKEYMARGIPFVVSKTEEDDFSESVYEYIYFVEENEEPLDIEKIIKWYEKIDLITARNDMRRYANLNYSWNRQMKRVVDIVYKNK